MAPYDAVIVGAGPAGSASAAILAGNSRRVLLLEKDRFPRPKVCGEFLSASAMSSLDRLAARDAILACGPELIEHGIVHLPGGARVCFPLSAPAIGLSRFALDHLLARRAQSAGAEARFETRVLAISRDSDGYVVRIAGAAREDIPARTVIGAWGRWDGLDKSLDRGFLSGRKRFLGWSRDYAGDTSFLAGLVQLYVFSGGYCGLSRVEGGVANLAGVMTVAAHARAGGGWEGVIAHARRSNRALDADLARLAPGHVGCLGTGPVFFTQKPAVENGVLMTGDAAGVLDPFSGEGQSIALASGILAADTIERGLAGELAIERVPEAYAQAWHARFGRRFAWGRWVRQLMLNSSVGSIAARVAGRRVVAAALRSLASSQS